MMHLTWSTRVKQYSGKVDDVELDRALELAVVASWEDMVKPGETCSVHVEYERQLDL